MARVEASPEAPYLHQPREGQWQTYSYYDVEQQARRIATGLQDQGYAIGDRIAILAKNSAEWVIADIAIMMAGMISVPIYATAGTDTIDYVLKHSEAKALFVGKLDSADALSAITSSITTIGFPYPSVSSDLQWNHWLETYAPCERVAEPDPDDILTLVYTSGSTGFPKGVVLTHKNIAAGVIGANNLFESGHNSVLSYLPMAHITERSVVGMGSFYRSLEIFFNDSLETFVDDLHHAKVTLFISVPRLWLKFRSQILSVIPDEQLQLMLESGQKDAVIAQIRSKLGFSHCKTFGSGSAPISKELLVWFERLGIEIGEGWGMTETSGIGCSNAPFISGDLGTIGRPLQGLDMSLSDEGEILIRGDSIFEQYYLNEEATTEAFADGWFKTGDKGEFTGSRAVRIIGRVKEQFKTAKGKYVSPVPIESKLSACGLVEQACVVGSGLPQPIALIVLADNVSKNSTEVTGTLDVLLQDVNTGLEGHQKLDALLLVEDAWTIESGLLTPTLKLKRSAIEARYQRLWQGNPLKGVCTEEASTETV